MKRFLALLLIVISVITVLPIQNVSAKAEKGEKLTLNYTYKELDTVNSRKCKLKLLGGKFTASKATFKSSNKKVAKVSSKGVVTARKEGTALITVTYQGNTYQCGIVVFDGNGTMYKLRKDAKNVRDNFSLRALDFDSIRVSGIYGENPYAPEEDNYDDYFTFIYQCYEIRKYTKNVAENGPWEGAEKWDAYSGFHESTHYLFDREQTIQNLLATGLFEEAPSEVTPKWAFGLKPIKPFTYNGVTYEHMAECDGYYISAYTGIIYDEFSEKNLSGSYYPCHFRNKKAMRFGAIDYSRYEEGGELTYAFFPTTITTWKGTSREEKDYLMEEGFYDEHFIIGALGEYRIASYLKKNTTYYVSSESFKEIYHNYEHRHDMKKICTYFNEIWPSEQSGEK